MPATDAVLAYTRVLAPPTHRRIVAAGLVARLPSAVLGFAALLHVQQRTGSFALAGTVSGVLAAANAAAGPLLGRLGDRRGQARVLLVAAVVNVVGVSALVVLAAPGVARGWLLLAAAVAGAGVPPVGSFTRARWSRLLGGDRPRLNTAFALESVLDQLVWVGGPAAASFLAAAVAPVWGLWATCAVGVTGTVLLAAQRSSDPRGGTPGAPRRRRWELPSVPVGTRALMVAGTAVGVTFGLADLSAVALAREAGAPELAGTVLGAGALGAVCGGLVVGARRPPEDPRRGLTAAAVLFLLGYGPLALAPGLAWIIVISFVAGTTFAPLSVAANRLLEASSPAHRLTETLALFSATLVIGTALGSGLGGRLVDHGGARFSYLFTAPVAALPVIAVGLAVLARRPGRAVRTVG